MWVSKVRPSVRKETAPRRLPGSGGGGCGGLPSVLGNPSLSRQGHWGHRCLGVLGEVSTSALL